MKDPMLPITQTLGNSLQLPNTVRSALLNHRKFYQTSIALGVGCLVWQMPANEVMAAEGMHFLGTLTAAVLLWAFRVFDDYAIGLMLLLSWLVLKVVPPEVALSGFSQSSWFFALGALGMGAAVNKSGVLCRIALKVTRVIKPDRKTFSCCFAAFGLLTTPVVPEVKARIVLVLPLARAIAEKIGFQPRSNATAGLAFSAYTGVSQMTFMFLTGSTYCLVGWSALPAQARLEFDWLTWLLAALPAGIVFFFILLGMNLAFFSPSNAEETHLTSQKTSSESQPGDNALCSEEWLTLAILGFALLGWISKPLHGIGEAWIAFGAMLTFALAGILDSKTFRNNVDWPIVLFFGVVYGMGGIVSHLHVDQWLAILLEPFFSGLSAHPLAFLSLTLLIVYLIRFFLVKAPAVILAMLIFLPAASEIGVHPGVLLITILLGVETWILPYQNPSYLLAYSSTEGQAFTHAQGRKLMLAKFVASFVALAVSVPYWKYLGLIQ